MVSQNVPVDDDFDIDIEVEYTSLSSGYRSPLVSRVAHSRLTVEMLAAEIPKIRAGEEASRLLDVPSGNRSEARVEELVRLRRAGENAKEKLFAAALPLIRAVANKEWRRRQQWGSQVPLEDLVQEANLGFLKGIAAFKPEAVRRSATNYLGQWMLVEMRRSSEVMDHDLQVGHDAGERFRKIRALRSRLMNDLGREPTDEEIAAASRNPDYVTRPSMLGRAPTTENEAPHIGKGVTESQVAEERESRVRVGHSARFHSTGSEDDAASLGGSVVDPERLTVRGVTEVNNLDPSDLVTEQAGKRVIAVLVGRVIAKMGMPGEQRDIIARRYGLPPHDDEMSVREISRTTGVHRERVTRILNAFSGEMTRKGGLFHEEVAALSADDLNAVGLDWVTGALGPWDPRLAGKHHVPRILTDDRSGSRQEEGQTTVQPGYLAWYSCTFHRQEFSALYPAPNLAPRQRACPQCHTLAVFVRGEYSGGT